jgi:pimeloyl-ACP methyl ester carboxylesterase
MSERPVMIGADRGLMGVVCEPDGAWSASRPAMIMLNAGLIHRVGPNRLHVRLARQLAAHGFLSLRLDLSGRGDSEPRRDGLSFAESGAVEAAEAMRYLEDTKGIRRFVLFGICSGAAAAAEVAHANDRVAGAVVIEGSAYPTARFYRRYYVKRFFRARTWWNIITGANAAGRRIRRLLGRPPAPASAGGEMVSSMAIPESTKTAVAAALQQMADRDVELLAVFSGSTKEYNYPGQLKEAFATVNFRGRLEESYYPQADHTFTRLQNQDVLVDRVLHWMQLKFEATS